MFKLVNLGKRDPFLMTLANFLNLNITKLDIRKASVVKNPNNSCIVQVTFYSKAHCLQLLDLKRSHGRITNSDVFNYSMSSNQIYINEYLPQDVHKPVTAARNLKKSMGLYKTWHKSGQIFIQATPNYRAVIINSHKDLQDLVKSLSTFITPQVPENQPQHQVSHQNWSQQNQMFQQNFTQLPQRSPPNRGLLQNSQFIQPPPRFSSNQGQPSSNNNNFINH